MKKVQGGKTQQFRRALTWFFKIKIKKRTTSNYFFVYFGNFSFFS